MKIAQPDGTAPWAAALLVSALYLLAALVLIQAGGCLQAPPINTGPVQTTIKGQRTEQQQDIYTVQLTALCMMDDEDDGPGVEMHMGTGVVLDSTHVLTAGHIVDCNTGTVVFAQTIWGSTAWMSVEKLDTRSDLGRLVALNGKKLSLGFYRAERASIGPTPVAGEDVCFTSAVPTRDRHCSTVSHVDHVPRLKPDGEDHDWWNSDVVITGKVVHGNSGSGVYDAAGNLVGIITELIPGEPTGGRFTSLQQHSDMTGP
jgi:hypothetical protein